MNASKTIAEKVKCFDNNSKSSSLFPAFQYISASVIWNDGSTYMHASYAKLGIGGNHEKKYSVLQNCMLKTCF
jgi:hypothetical protein